MLTVIQGIIDNPSDIPDIPQASAEYLMVRCNHAYLSRTGALDDLRKAGYSESFIAGFIEGLGCVPELIELMQSSKEPEEEEEESNVLFKQG